MSSEREIIKKLFESTNMKEDASILPDEDDKKPIIRGEHQPISTADRSNIDMSEAVDEDFDRSNIESHSREVIETYQNANKWLDSLKEELLIDYGMRNFSEIVHQLAHKMPKMFDIFGDTLHIINMKTPYPSTVEWYAESNNVSDVVASILDILSGIRAALVNFIEAAEGTPLSDTIDTYNILIDNIEEDMHQYELYSNEIIDKEPSDLLAWDITLSVSD